MWPPSPTVEDEASSLAREYGLDAIPHELKSEIPPAESRGAVDQYPIILDNNAQDCTERHDYGDSKGQKDRHVKIIDNQSSDESSGPATPPRIHTRAHHSAAISGKPGLPSNSMPKLWSQSNNVTDTDDSLQRGRPQIARIHTEIGNDLRPAVLGQRRAPSPYSYVSAGVTPHVQIKDERTTASATFTQPSNRSDNTQAETRRARSAHPDRCPSLVETSDSDYRRRRRHRSKSRSDGKKLGNSSSDESHYRNRSRHRHERSSTSTALPEANRMHAAASMTPPITPYSRLDSPYASGPEETYRHHLNHSKRHERRLSRDSPYTSSAEEFHKYRTSEDKKGGRSRRSSINRKEKPHLDLSDHRKPYPSEKNVHTGDRDTVHHQHEHNHHGSLTPTSLRTPLYSNADLQRAMESNRKRRSHHEYRNSETQSPLTSPPTSPPRTPQREKPPRDYFELGGHSSHSTNISHASKSRSRNSSVDEGQHKDQKASISLLSAATIGASLAKAAPSLSRSSTASAEHSLGSLQSKPQAYPWPAKSNPMYEEPKVIDTRDDDTRPVEYRSYSYKAPEQRQVSSRPVSRAGSVNSSDEQFSGRPQGYVSRMDRPASRDGIFPTVPHIVPHEQIKPLQRAYSYTPSTDLPPTSRPGSSHRTYSSTTSSTTAPAFHNGLSAGPSPLTRYVQSSPASTDKLGTHSTVASHKMTALPLCPTPNSVTGFHHWYTMQGLQDFDICAACMTTLGKTVFRDHFVPSLYRPPTGAITCAMNRPWIRIIFTRSLKDGKADLSSIKDLSYLPTSIMPCSGPKSDVRRWYHMVDPTSGNVIPQIDVCTACVRAAETVFPDIRAARIFDRPSSKLSQEKICGLQTRSKYFHAMVDELDKLNGFIQNKDLRSRDIQSFSKFIQSTRRHKACTRDSRLPAQAWHYLPELPEFTICEECYLEVIWPLKDKSIAKDIPATAKMVPLLHKGEQIQKSSCQLYSDRMRRIFRDAVAHSDFDGLRKVAKLRFEMEHRLHEMQGLYEQDMQAGIDRRTDIERVKALWTSYE